MHCYSFDPNKKISNFVEENAILKKELKELSNKYEILKEMTNRNFQNGDENFASRNISKKLVIGLQATEKEKINDSNSLHINTVKCLKDCLSKKNFQYTNLKAQFKSFNHKFSELVNMIDECVGNFKIEEKAEIQNILNDENKLKFKDIMISGNKIKEIIKIIFELDEKSNEINATISRNTDIIEIYEHHDSFANYEFENNSEFEKSKSKKEEEFAENVNISNISNISYVEEIK